MARRKKSPIPGLSFSWKRAAGITQAKQKIARKTGIPLSGQGRQRKMGKAVGCCIPFVFLMIGLTAGSVSVGRIIFTMLA